MRDAGSVRKVPRGMDSKDNRDNLGNMGDRQDIQDIVMGRVEASTDDWQHIGHHVFPRHSPPPGR